MMPGKTEGAMAGTIEVQTEVLRNLRKKYNMMNQLMELTKDLDKAARSGDKVSFGMTLEMRWNTMAAVDKLDVVNRSLIAGLPEDVQFRTRRLLNSGGETPHLENPLETDIFDMQRLILTTVQKIMNLDDEIRRKTGNAEK